MFHHDAAILEVLIAGPFGALWLATYFSDFYLLSVLVTIEVYMQFLSVDRWTKPGMPTSLI